MEKQQDSNVSQLSLDERFSEKGRRSSARLRHQSLDRGMDRPSPNRRFGGDEGEQLPMTAPHCRWVQASSTDRQPLDQRFSSGDHRLSASGLHHLKPAVEQQDNRTGLQLRRTVSRQGSYLSLRFTAATDITLRQVTAQARQPTSTAGPLMNYIICRSLHRLAPNYGTRTKQV